MLSLFANPFAMIFGVLLISSPIIIHLINRMKYKRVRWAAMEFLLKSQKRARRKLIIEQLILLLLRILLMLLVGLLLARFIGCDKGREGQTTLHVILFDNTLSNSDTIRSDDGQNREVYQDAKQLITDRIGVSVVQATSPQFVTILPLTDLDNPRDFGRLNNTTLDDMRTYLAPTKASLMHADLTDGLRAAKKLFEADATKRPVLHVVGDFRSADWGEQNKVRLTEAFEELKKAGVEVHLLDAVSPERSEQTKSPLSAENLAITEISPDSKIVAKYQSVEFTLKVRNYSNSEKKAVNVRIRVNGAERPEGMVVIPSIPPNGETVSKFVLNFDRTGSDDDVVAAIDKLTDAKLNLPPEERDTLQLTVAGRFPVVSAHLEGEVGGIAADNVRYAAIEVRDRVPILIVDDGPVAQRGTKEAESFFLQKLFTEPIKGYDVQIKNSAELETLNLQQFVGVFVCDVPRFTPAAIRNLEDYAKAGGGVSFFMGPNMKADVIPLYNEQLYRDGKGIFPVPLDKAIGLDIPEDKRSALKFMRSLTYNKKLLTSKKTRSHPALEKLYTDNRGQAVSEDEYEKFFIFVVIDRYIRVNTQALQAGNSDLSTLVYLQNTSPMDAYTDRVNKLTDEFPITEPKWERYSATLTSYRTQLRQMAASTSELFNLGKVLESLLDDPGNEALKRPSMVNFWAAAENAILKEKVEKLRDEVSFGDPLYLAKSFGKGRVTAFMTSAGASWNDMEGFGKAYYPPMMINMLGYMASAGTDSSPLLGRKWDFTFEKNNYDAKYRTARFSEDVKGNKIGFSSLGENLMATEERTEEKTKDKPEEKKSFLKLDFNLGKDPGTYLFRFAERRAEPGKAAPDGPAKADFRVLAYNVDVEHEGNLARANSNDITQIAKAPLHTATDEKLVESLLSRKRDLSENPWFYFVMLLVLIAEQAMSVRLSFHTRSDVAAA
ncbi:BatA domain-containing protein [Zavarzinella formosa]|uniref:BatA domain-containing protein n=1 Tax=Zavarzinella formosa TaxID=360055 RepID=UPI0002D5871D|nr:BatA domain-containing protein [Zavarzinella formosa]